MKINLIFLLIFSGILIFSSVTLVQAADEITPIFCSIARAVFAASWGIIAIAWTIVTVLFLIALGNPEKFSMAKKGVVVAIIGTVVIMLNTAAINIIANTIGSSRDGGDVCGIGGGGGGGGGGMVCDPPCVPPKYCFQQPGSSPICSE